MEQYRKLQERRDGLMRDGTKQHEQGKLTARERIERLFDPGTFVEVGAMVRHRCTYFGMEKKQVDGDGVITGYGMVNGRTVFAYAQDFTVMGGSLGEMHANKICQILDRAMLAGAPVVGMNDSGGARIQEGIDSLAGYGRIFYRNTMASGIIPQITAIMGPCAGGAVYSPALTDFVFMTQNAGKMFITGPDVIRQVTGESVSAEELGGAQTHESKSGVAHFVAENDEACIDQIRRLLSFLPGNCRETAPLRETRDSSMRLITSLETIMPDRPGRPYDVMDVIRELVDDGEVFEYQKGFAQNLVTCFAHLDGRSVGILANQPKVRAGCIDIDASDKAARFVRTCDAFGLPLVTLVDVPGYLPGTQQEYGGIIRHGAKLLYAYSEATVPKISVILRKAYGGAYLAMCCKELGADATFAWPTAEIAVMGPDGAANIIFRKSTGDERKENVEKYREEFATPYKAAERGLVDEVIYPAETRCRLITALRMLKGKQARLPEKKHGNLPL